MTHGYGRREQRGRQLPRLGDAAGLLQSQWEVKTNCYWKFRPASLLTIPHEDGPLRDEGLLLVSLDFEQLPREDQDSHSRLPGVHSSARVGFWPRRALHRRAQRLQRGLSPEDSELSRNLCV